jgi:hypothetical protein
LFGNNKVNPIQEEYWTKRFMPSKGKFVESFTENLGIGNHILRKH